MTIWYTTHDLKMAATLTYGTQFSQIVVPRNRNATDFGPYYVAF